VWTPYLKKMWKIKAPLKIRFFTWQTIRDRCAN
jgi:hypothetical protein